MYEYKGMSHKSSSAMNAMHKKGMKDENDSYLKPGQKDVDDMKMSARKKALMKKMGKK